MGQTGCHFWVQVRPVFRSILRILQSNTKNMWFTSRGNVNSYPPFLWRNWAGLHLFLGVCILLTLLLIYLFFSRWLIHSVMSLSFVYLYFGLLQGLCDSGFCRRTHSGVQILGHYPHNLFQFFYWGGAYLLLWEWCDDFILLQIYAWYFSMRVLVLSTCYMCHEKYGMTIRIFQDR